MVVVEGETCGNMLAFVDGFKRRAYEGEILGICADGEGGLERDLTERVVRRCCEGEERKKRSYNNGNHL